MSLSVAKCQRELDESLLAQSAATWQTGNLENKKQAAEREKGKKAPYPSRRTPRCRPRAGPSAGGRRPAS